MIRLLAALIGCVISGPQLHGQDVEAPPAAIRVINVKLPESWEMYRTSLTVGPPSLRGFRFPLLDQPNALWPIKPPGPQDAQPLQQAAAIVADRLAPDGLLVTLAQVIKLLGPANFVSDSRIESLRDVGLPVDWLDYFALDGPATGRDDLIREIARLQASGENETHLYARLRAAGFEFHPTKPGFCLSTEEGERPIERVRFQAPEAAYWRGPGDGGTLDILRQLIQAWPEGKFIVSVKDSNLPALLKLARDWPLRRKDQQTLLASPWQVEQWAQDNGKPGYLRDGPKAQPIAAMLLPRFSSRGEERTVMDPDSSLTARSLADAGLVLVSSPLIFQGGNLLPVRDAATGRRILLIGEAEIYRNTALGLSRDQVLDAFRSECGVDQCVVLPAVSFHLDFELSVRTHRGKTVAFVNDEAAAARIILRRGVDALVHQGAINSQTGEKARSLLDAGKDREAVELLSGPANRPANRDGAFPAEFAAHFSAGPTDSGSANLQRFLLALDILASRTVKPEEMPPDALTRAYIGALQRRTTDRAGLHHLLASLGWRVVPVPSLADEDRSINYLNGFQEPGRYIMPAWGGFYAPLDDSAETAIRTALNGEVSVVKVFSSESQRRLGAIHCSAAVWPKPQ
jgi:hypothetical protein